MYIYVYIYIYMYIKYIHTYIYSVPLQRSNQGDQGGFLGFYFFAQRNSLINSYIIAGLENLH